MTDDSGGDGGDSSAGMIRDVVCLSMAGYVWLLLLLLHAMLMRLLCCCAVLVWQCDSVGSVVVWLCASCRVLTHDAVPCGVVLLVELLLDVRGHVLLDAVLAEGGGGDVDGLLLHLLAHVGILDHSAAQVTHSGEAMEGKG